MTKNQLIRTIAFLLVVSVLLVTLCDLFEYQNSYISEKIETYQDLPKNTVDGVVIGTSGIDRFWITPKAYDEYGMTVYPLTSDALPVWMVLPLLKEATKRQDPKLVVIDMRPLINGKKDTSLKFNVPSRRIIDGLDFFSFTRFEAINNTLEARKAHKPESERFDPSYFLSFIRFHNKWESGDLTFDELKEPKSQTLGFLLHNPISVTRRKVEVIVEEEKTDEKIPMYSVTEGYLNELFEYLKKQDYQVLFLDTAHYHSPEESKSLNTLCEVLDKEGFDYYCCTTAEGNLDEATDFYSNGHVNYYGAEKFTTWFSAYLNTHYDLPDRREDKKCDKDWKGVYDYIRSSIAEYEAELQKQEAEKKAQKAQ